jgi:diadenosine tetraphosphatase ApaH/serine/threonine PP2A family protein phosphatase
VVRRAYISDIHGNAPALEAVLADIDRRGIGEIWCGGDLVGYGPEPERCIELVRARVRRGVMGNHDWALLNAPAGFNPVAAEAIRCNRRMMGEHCLAGVAPGCQAWDYLRGLPDGVEEPGLLQVHASPRDRLSEYVLASDVAYGPSEKIRDIFSRFEGLCVVGHSHRPGVVTPDFRWLCPAELPEGLELEPGRKYLANDGSVGQPRDGDPRACYLEQDGRRLSFHRVEYDCRRTMELIRRSGCLAEVCAARLALGR